MPLSPEEIKKIRERALREYDAGKSFVDPTPSPTPAPAKTKTSVEDQDMKDLGLINDDAKKRSRLFEILRGLGSKGSN
jgi:hypothetical protein